MGVPVVPDFNISRLANRILHRLAVRPLTAVWGVYRSDQRRQSTHTGRGPTTSDMRRKHDCHETTLLKYFKICTQAYC